MMKKNTTKHEILTERSEHN